MGLVARLRSADEGDHLVEVVEGDHVALEDVGALLGLAQVELRPAAHDLAAGTVLSREHVAIKKPGTGLPPDMLDLVIGRRLARAVTADQLLAREDIEGLPGQ